MILSILIPFISPHSFVHLRGHYSSPTLSCSFFMASINFLSVSTNNSPSESSPGFNFPSFLACSMICSDSLTHFRRSSLYSCSACFLFIQCSPCLPAYHSCPCTIFIYIILLIAFMLFCKNTIHNHSGFNI